MQHFSPFIILLLFVSVTPESNVTLKNCTLQDIQSVQQNCEPFANELNSYNDDYDGKILPDDIIGNMTDLCSSVIVIIEFVRWFSDFNCIFPEVLWRV